jgi:hypothetical protein
MYEKYINLGFKREEMIENVEFKRHGYHGYLLIKEFGKHVSIQVYWMELDKPELWVKGVKFKVRIAYKQLYSAPKRGFFIGQ